MTKSQTTQPDADLKQRFFEAMSHVVSTVNVVTTNGPSGRAGVTVSAMSSVSADTPRPTLLVCVNESSAAAASIVENGKFCVNILRDHQNHISDVFAGRFKDEFPDKFAASQWTAGDLDQPRVLGGLAALDCKIVSVQKIGTHHVIFGEVQDIAIGDDGPALIYARRSYSYSQPIELGNNSGAGDEQAKLSIGCLDSFAPFVVPRMIKSLSDAGIDVEINIVEGDNRRVKDALISGEVQYAILYDHGLGEEMSRKQIAKLSPYMLLAADHPLSGKENISAADLAGETMICVAEETSGNHLEPMLKDAGFAPDTILKATSFEMMRGMVAHGLGFGIAMTQAASDISYDGLRVASRKLPIDAASSNIILATMKDAPAHKAGAILDALTLN